MLKIKNYVKVNSLAEAYELNQKKTARILGGMVWMKMGNRAISTAIDLSGLGLDAISENDDEFVIGCMTPLHDLETNEALNTYTHGAMKESVHNIVGVQFRNLATVGGSLFGRYGFSDVLTMFMALDAYVELYHGGIVSIQEFATMRPTPDVLVRVIIKKSPLRVVYMSQRNTKTDFPVLTCAVSQIETTYTCTIGARPLKAVTFKDENHFLDSSLSDESIQAFANDIAKKLVLGSNLRGSADYRRRIAKVLMKRALTALREENHHAY